MNQSAKFWDRIAKRYAKQAVGDEAAYQKKLQITRDYLRPDMRVLEFGCGTGSTAITHAPFVKHIRAIDISSKMIEIARAKADAAKIDNVSFECAAIDDLNLVEFNQDDPKDDDKRLDLVLGLNIVHLLENWEEVITKVHSILKPGGLFVSSTACLADSMNWLKIVMPIGRFFGLMPLVMFFSTNELLASLRSAGFDIEYQWQPGKKAGLFIVAKKGA